MRSPAPIQSVEPPGEPPSSTTCVPFTIREFATLQHYVDDFAGSYGENAAARLTGELFERFQGKHPADEICRAVADHLDNHPQLLRDGLLDRQELDSRRQAREQLGDRYAQEALNAFKAGDLEAASAAIEHGERACPDGRPNKVGWTDMRGRVEAARALPETQPAAKAHLVGQAFPPMTRITHPTTPSSTIGPLTGVQMPRRDVRESGRPR
jgi:hypothetical protein